MRGWGDGWGAPTPSPGQCRCRVPSTAPHPHLCGHALAVEGNAASKALTTRIRSGGWGGGGVQFWVRMQTPFRCWVYRTSTAMQVTAVTTRRAGRGFRVQENPNLQILAQNPVPLMSEQMTQGRQRLVMRNRGRWLLFPGGLAWRINKNAHLHPRGAACSNLDTQTGAKTFGAWPQ